MIIYSVRETRQQKEQAVEVEAWGGCMWTKSENRGLAIQGDLHKLLGVWNPLPTALKSDSHLPKKMLFASLKAHWKSRKMLFISS